MSVLIGSLCLLLYINFTIVFGFTDLPCVSCDTVQCGTAPQGCELDKIPCGCCFTCVRKSGEMCDAFTPRCGTGLKCLTPGGMFDGRPPWYKTYFKGVCIVDPTLTGLVPTRRTHSMA